MGSEEINEKYIVDKRMRYRFKDLTGLMKEHEVGWTLFYGQTRIGGVLFQMQRGPVPEKYTESVDAVLNAMRVAKEGGKALPPQIDLDGGMKRLVSISERMRKPFVILTLVALELLPEHRGKGMGSEFVRELLGGCDFLNAGAQQEKSWKWWEGMGAKRFSVVCSPGTLNVHTVWFVLGKTKEDSDAYAVIMEMMTLAERGGECDFRRSTDFTMDLSK